MGQMKKTIEIINKIGIEGRPEVLFDSVPDEEKKKLVLILSERVMNPAGYKRKSGIQKMEQSSVICFGNPVRRTDS